MLVTAYIGFGNSVCRYHLPYVNKREEFIKVKYIYRQEEDRVGDMEREGWYPHIIFTSDLNQVLNDPEVNLVVVNTPNRFHVHYTRKALEHGKNVLCEKAFALTSQEARDIFQFAKEKGLLVMANHNRRYDPDMLTLKKIIDSGVLGDIVEVESHYDYFRPQVVKSIHDFRFLYGLAVHPLDQIISLFGVPKYVVCDCRSIENPGETDDYYDFNLFYDRFKAIVKTSYYVKINYPRFCVHGKKGSFILPPLGHNSEQKHKPGPIVLPEQFYPEEQWGTLSYINDKGEDITMKVPIEHGDYGRIYDNIYDVLEQNGKKAVQDEEVISVLEIIEAGMKMAKEAK